DLVEHVLRSIEKIQLVLAQAGKRTTGTGRSSSDARIDRVLPELTGRGAVRARRVLREPLSKEIETPRILRQSRRRQSRCPQHHRSDGQAPRKVRSCHCHSPPPPIMNSRLTEADGTCQDRPTFVGQQARKKMKSIRRATP